MAQLNNLVNRLQKNHQDLANLTSSFQTALETADHKKAREILDKIDDTTTGHFRFEENYLYPRMKRLTLQIIEKLHNGQKTISGFIGESKNILNTNRLSKDKASVLLEMLPAVSECLKDCNDMVFLVNKFAKEEKAELNQKFKECCRIK